MLLVLSWMYSHSLKNVLIVLRSVNVATYDTVHAKR